MNIGIVGAGQKSWRELLKEFVEDTNTDYQFVKPTDINTIIIPDLDAMSKVSEQEMKEYLQYFTIQKGKRWRTKKKAKKLMSKN